MIIGVLAGIVPFIAVVYLKGVFGYDDALDTFGVHAIGGTMGAILTGILADSSVNGNLLEANSYAAKSGLAKLITDHALLGTQLKAVVLTVIISVVATAVIALVVKVLIGLRPTPEVETAGLDVSEHSEEGYVL